MGGGLSWGFLEVVLFKGVCSGVWRGCKGESGKGVRLKGWWSDAGKF